MHNDTVLVLGWMVVPLIAYVAGRFAITRNEHGRSVRPPIDPTGRLEELRHQVAEGRRVTRGRMAEAVRLAESAGPSPRERQS